MEKFDIYKILICPECRGDSDKNENSLLCKKCNVLYVSHPYINFDDKTLRTN